MKIAKKTGRYDRILAIGDIHGCFNHLLRLLEAVQPNANDLIVTLGDYTDRGPDSNEVLDFLIELHNGGNLVPLRGNHDSMMLMLADGIEPVVYYPDPPAGKDGREPWEQITQGGRLGELWCNNQNGGQDTLAAYGDPSARALTRPVVELRAVINALVPPEHLDFLRHTCVDALETDKFIFAHAGVDPKRGMAEQNLFSLHWLRNPGPHISGKNVVVGHTPLRNFFPADFGGHTIFLDTGAFMAAGCLTCMDVQNGQVWQAKSDRVEKSVCMIKLRL